MPFAENPRKSGKLACHDTLCMKESPVSFLEKTPLERDGFAQNLESVGKNHVRTRASRSHTVTQAAFGHGVVRDPKVRNCVAIKPCIHGQKSSFLN